MQIVCPQCSTAYEIAAAVIGTSGRTVRCTRCKTVWFAEAVPEVATAAITESLAPAGTAESGPPDDPSTADDRDEPDSDTQPPIVPDDEPFPDTAQAAETAAPESAGPEAVELPAFESPTDEPRHDAEPAAPEPMAAATEMSTAAARQAPALADIPIPVADAPPLAPEPGDGMSTAGEAIDHDPEDIERVAARRRARAASRKRRGKRQLPVPAVAFLLALVCAALIVLRKDVVRHFPQMASFYAAIGLPVNLRGLVFNDVKISNETHDGVPVLVVEGFVASTVAMPVEVPRLRFGLRNTSGIEVYSWTAQPSQPVLEPGERMPFRTRLASPPADGTDLQVRFFTRRDAPGDAK